MLKNFLAGAANQALNIGAYGDAGLGAEFDTVLRDGGDHRRFNDFGGNAHLYSLENITAGKVDGAGFFKSHFDIGALRGDQSIDDTIHITAGQVVRFQLGDRQVQAGFIGFDQGVNQALGLDAADPHTDQRTDGYVHAAGQGGNPQAHGHKVQEDRQGDQRDYDDRDQEDGLVGALASEDRGG